MPADRRGDRRLTSCALREARVSEADTLTELVKRSKAYWGYSPEFMKACAGELEVTSCYLEANPAFVAEREGVGVGFCALERVSDDVVELGFLFVDPGYIGQGIGAKLLSRALSAARGLSYRSLIIQGDPHAEGFYRAVGARRAGTRESESLPGRHLPLFEISL